MQDKNTKAMTLMTTNIIAQQQQHNFENQTSSLDQQWANLNLSSNNNKKSSKVLLEGYVEDEDFSSETMSSRTKSLTDEDLDELKGCVDLGFGFSYDEIPELCNTLPALELCYSMSHKFHKTSTTCSPDNNSSCSESSSETESLSLSSSPIASWKISSPGDRPEDVKARLKYWAQAVACTVKLCS